jgi:hypothetical protein
VPTPLFSNETRERKVFGPDILQGAESQVRTVRENLWMVKSRQKSYTDHRLRGLSFKVEDFVYLKVSPMRGLLCFKVRGKLTPRFIGLFKIKEEREEKIEGRISEFLFRFVRISRVRFILRG